MPLQPELLANWQFQDMVQRYEERDTILYALGVGCGTSNDDLRFVYEKQLHVLPSMATILGDPGFWLADPTIGADWRRIVHGEQSLTLHAPLPPAATVVGRERVDDLIDKGREKGAVVYTSRDIREQTTGRLLATLNSTIVLRGDGGFGGCPGEKSAPPAWPDRPCDASRSIRTSARSAMIYRLSGDLNPLHVDPEVARYAGFQRPILHGLCAFGIATRAIIQECCDGEPAKLRSLGVRFRAPVFPGETLETRIWRTDERIWFRSFAVQREVVVLDGGIASISHDPF